MWPKKWTFNEPDENEAATAERQLQRGNCKGATARVALSGLCHRINPATASGSCCPQVSAQHLLLSFKAQLQCPHPRCLCLCLSPTCLQLSVCIVLSLTCLAFRLASIESGHVNCFASSWLVSAERQREGRGEREGEGERGQFPSQFICLADNLTVLFCLGYTCIISGNMKV